MILIEHDMGVVMEIVDRVVVLDSGKEFKAFNDNKEILEKELDCEIIVLKAEESNDPKAKQASPSKPSVLVQ